MKSVRVATYEIRRGSFQEIADIASEGMLRTFREQDGFIQYGIADLGDKKCLSLSVWETRKDAEAAAPLVATWVHDNLGGKVEIQSSVVGDLAFYEGVPAAV